MSESLFSVTVKVNGDLFTIRGNTADEFKNNVQAAVVGELVTYVEALQEAAGHRPAKPADPVAVVQNAFPNAQVVSTTPAPQPQAQAQSAPAGWNSTPATPTCIHGPRQWREGISKSSGKPYRGWFCTCPNRDEQCKPQFGAN